MNLRDADSGKILWESKEDVSKSDKEHEGPFDEQSLVFVFNYTTFKKKFISLCAKICTQMQGCFTRNQFFFRRCNGTIASGTKSSFQRQMS